jgi:hypothetical protein
VIRTLFLLAGVFAVSFPQQFDWAGLPSGRWVEVPTLGEAAPKVFHGGATIIPERNLVIFFGSDTHAPTALEKGESNAVWRLDLESRTWSQDYVQDPKSTYRILPDDQTETSMGRPWAIHTFAAVDWDPSVRRVVVVSGPLHARFDPKKRFPMFTKPNWWVSLRNSHWEYEPDSKRWQRLETGAPSVFAGAVVRDSDRDVLVAHNGAATWELDRRAGKWTKYDAPSKPGWHQNMVYDTFARRVLLLGNNSGDTTLYSWDPGRHVWGPVTTTGTILPANGAAIAYDTKNHVMLFVANDYKDQYYNPTARAVTFLYHSEGQRWERLAAASPELYGMNYLTQYDPVRNVFLFFEKTRSSGDRIRVRAFRSPGSGS